ncbi:putative OsmC-like protein [Sphingomonas jinjuensis]|uniref:Putative OsmC-like protein n=1 Tax=Sphingomonas jinjuensis TaxID=535907 RepID=A0A840FCY1_9SPHN|nr:OsmC family protein [Sphingomonas jinjuensis]MBB4154601.1 putative OsmC-like protein [Sphingomonas jinjuensis]
MADTLVTYDGAMRCRAVHGDSGAVIVADAPVEMGGSGDGFSPSDLLAVSLGGCILSIMAVATARDGLDLSGATACVTKDMADSPRRITRLAVTVRVPGTVDDRLRRKLLAAANACPVHQALGIEAPIRVEWEG